MTSAMTRSIGGNSGRNRSHNRRVVLEFVRANEPAGRADIARSCGLSTQAVSNICDSLVFDGLLLEDGYRTGARGKPVKRYRFDGKKTFAIGIELRPDAVLTAVLNLSGDRIYSNRVEIAEASPEFAIPVLQTQIDAALGVIGRDVSHLLGVGIVMPWSFGPSDTNPPTEAELPGWGDIDIQAVFQTALKCPVIIENDATAAAISERVSGVAKGMDNFCFCVLWRRAWAGCHF